MRLDENGRITPYYIEEEVDLLSTLPDSKPSKRIIKSKKCLKGIKALINLRRNHNVSWYSFLKERMLKNLDSNALFYRGSYITYRDVLKKADDLAKYLVDVGIKAGDEIPVCMTNTPELVYLLLAANKIGAKLNIFGEQFDKDYIAEILNGTSKKILFSDDSRYDSIKDVVQSVGIDNVVVSSLSDSVSDYYYLSKDYEPELDDYYRFDNKVNDYKKEDHNVVSYYDAVNAGHYSKTNVEAVGDLETDFLITYTSGSTIIGRPKPIIHQNRSLVVSGLFHDVELSGNPVLPKFKCMAHIPPESNSNLIACISDILMQSWTVCLEPEYDAKKCLDYIFINKPNYLVMTTSFFIEAAKQYLYNKKFIGRNLGFVFTAFAVGEKLSPGEEKLINTFLRKGKTGREISLNGFKLPFTTIGTACGDCEHGGIFYTLWKKMTEMKTKLLGVKDCGNLPESFVNSTVLKQNENGEYVECDYNEIGIVVANSYTNMSGYKDNKEATEKLLITDNLGRTWLSCNTYGYIDKVGGIHYIGRRELVYGKEIDGVPLYKIEESISKDTKRILSVQSFDRDGQDCFVIQCQHGVDPNEAVISIKSRLINLISEKSVNDLDIIVLPFEESFPLTHSGKRKLQFDDRILSFENNKPKVLAKIS